MSAPRETESQVSFRLDLGIDNASHEFTVSPLGDEPYFAESVNTRLSVRPGVPCKAPQLADVSSGAVTAGAACGGIIPAGNVDSSIAFFHTRDRNKRVVRTTAGNYTNSLDAAQPNPSYWPAQVSRAGASPGCQSWIVPATVYDALNERTWFAHVKPNELGNDAAIYLSCLDDHGGVLIQPTLVYNYSGAGIAPANVVFVGLTAHGENGVVLWYHNGTSIKAARVSVSGLTVTLTDTTTIYIPVAYPAGSIAVSSDSDEHAFVASVHSSTGTTLVIHKVDMSDLSVTTTPYASATSTTSRVAIKHLVLGSAQYVAVISGNNASGAAAALYNAETMVQTWGGTTALTGTFTEVTAGFWVGYSMGTAYSVVLFTASDTAGGSTASATVGTSYQMRVLSSGAHVYTGTIPWMVAMGPQQLLKVGTDEVYPVAPMQRMYDYTAGATDPGFLMDPAIELVRFDGRNGFFTPVGRFGVDTAKRYSANYIRSSSGYVNGSKVFFLYAEDYGQDSEVLDGWTARYVEVDFAAGQPNFDVTPEGTAIIAAALPALWDGVDVTEVNPLHAPKLYVESTGGSATALTAGTYYFQAQLQWRDGAGRVHRSAPSEKRSVVSTGVEQPKLHVALPVSLRDGARQDSMKVLLFASSGATVGDTVVNKQNYVRSGTSTTHVYTYSQITQPAEGDDKHPPIYSDGAPDVPLVSQCPGAARDVAIVGKRAWLIEAERPWVAWPSKERDLVNDAGVAFEWNADLRVEFPGSAGEALRVVEWNQAPIFFTTTGIYVVTGGPDNALFGQFNPPEQLASVPCSNAKAVVKTPAGILFLSNDRFHLFAGSVRRFDNIDTRLMGTCAFATVLKDRSEALFVGNNGLSYVYNYALDRWTTWDSAVIPAVSCGARVPSTGDLLMYSPEDGKLVHVDTSEVSTTAQMRFSAGYMALGGPQDNNVVREVLIHGVSAGSHGVSVTLTYDYGAGSVTRAFSAAEVASAALNGQYTLSVGVANVAMRAIKVAVAETDAAGDGFRPLSVTVLFAKQAGTLRDAVRTTGRK